MLAVPLLFVIVAEFSSAAREMDLKKGVENERQEFQLFVSEEVLPDKISVQFEKSALAELRKETNLGRFPYIHYLNVGVIFGGITLLFFLPEHNSATIISFFLLLGLLAALPIIEVCEYDHMLDEGIRPKSFGVHLACFAIQFTAIISTSIVSPSSGNSVFFIFTLVIMGVVPGIISSKMFINQLQSDLERLCEDSTTSTELKYGNETEAAESSV